MISGSLPFPSGILVIFLAALGSLPGLILLRLPLLPDAELLLDGLLTLLDLFRMLLRVLLGVILQLVELAHDAPPVPMSDSPGLSARGHPLPDAGGTTPPVPAPAIAARRPDSRRLLLPRLRRRMCWLTDRYPHIGLVRR